MTIVRRGAAALALFLLLPFNASAGEYDWLHWRGPQGDGSSRELGLVEEFDPDAGTNLLWKRDDLGTISTPVVMDGKLYLLARKHLGEENPDPVRDGERVVCVDAKTGETIWENDFNVYLSDVPAERVGWSCVAADPETNSVFALGVCGLFQCLDADTGEVKWSDSMHERFGLLSTYGGRTNVPMIYEDLVLVSAVIIGWGEMAVPADRFVAFDKRTGEVRWFNGTTPSPHDTTYSTPFFATLAGQDAMVFGSGDGKVWAFQPRTGQPIWNYAFSMRGLNTSPVVKDDVVYMGHSEENIGDNTMGSIVALNGALKGNITPTGAIWRHKEVMVGKSSPFLYEGRLYAIDDRAGLWIFDAKTGEQLHGRGSRPRANMKLGTVMRSSPLVADGKFYLCTANGRWWILKPSDETPGVEVVQRQLRLPGGSNGSPIVSAGVIYLPTTAALYAIGEEGHEPKLAPAEEKQPEAKDWGQDPAHVQVVPAEALLAPGESQQFKVRLFNSGGQFIEESDAVFSVDAGGEITEDGMYTAGEDASHQASYVTATVGDLKGQARVRVVGELPWEFDFAGGRLPITWVGMRNRHIVVDLDLAQKLRAEDAITHQLYLFFRKAFVDSGEDRLVFDDTLPRRPWSSLIRTLELQGTFNTLAQIQERLSPALERLVEEKFLADYQWGPGGGESMGLAVTRGPFEIENAVAVKLERIPIPGDYTKLGTRSQGWMGPDHLSDYTVQADFLATEREHKLPDMGLTAQRYSVDLQGAGQKLQIRSWVTQERMAQETPFSWKPGVWYTIKFQAENAGDKAVLRAKVWPRDSEEPSDWTLSAEDPQPNLRGAPGFYGNAKDTEFYIDNVKVWKNES